MSEFIDTNDERIDELNIDGYRLWQNGKLFRFGIDAVLLAAFAKIKKTDKVVDICSGSGIIPFLYLARRDVSEITAVEYFEYFCSLMKRSAQMNGCEDRINIVNADIKNISEYFPKSTFDVLTVNPPYEKNGHGIDCPSQIKNAARRETLCDITDVVAAAHHLLKTGGRMYMIHRPSRLCDIFCALRSGGFEPREVQLVSSKQGSVPNLVLISAIKGAPPYLKVLPNLVIYNEDGSYTEESSKIYTERKDNE
ncbi:MAG: tRNA1(Val) (adenine(37)-N6)-methyltransferase [Clostridia bacterium]|nr:tRNA1(Val) (adenine(37)-N6)-methyltransferase [Clostridia bacterium]